MINKPLENLKARFGLIEKVSKRCQRYLDIYSRGVITKQETIALKSILSDRGLRHSLTNFEVNLLTEKFESVAQSLIRITPEHTEQGLGFFKSLIYTPTGKLRAKWKQYLGAIDSNVTADDMKQIIDNFDHFELAGFQDKYNPYGTAYYTPIWRTIAKDKSCFEYTQCCISEAQKG